MKHFGGGGLIAAKRQQNVSVGVVFLTNGRNCYGKGGTLGELTNAEREKTVADLSALLRDFAPEEMFVPHRTDRHKDHEAAFALLQQARAGAAVHQVEYVIWHFGEAPLFRGAEWKAVHGATMCRLIRPQPAPNKGLLPPMFRKPHFCPALSFGSTGPLWKGFTQNKRRDGASGLN